MHCIHPHSFSETDKWKTSRKDFLLSGGHKRVLRALSSRLGRLKTDIDFEKFLVIQIVLKSQTSPWNCIH